MAAAGDATPLVLVIELEMGCIGTTHYRPAPKFAGCNFLLLKNDVKVHFLYRVCARNARIRVTPAFY